MQRVLPALATTNHMNYEATLQARGCECDDSIQYIQVCQDLCVWGGSPCGA